MYSQAGQDFWLVGEVFCQKRSGFFVDVGAHDGIRFSNTCYLERVLGWQGICIEAQPDTFQQLRRNRSCKCVQACVDREIGMVEYAPRGMVAGIISAETDNASFGDEGEDVLQLPTQTLESILDAQGAPQVIDYLSVDTEGAEERVLSSFDFGRYRFRAMTIERPNKTLMSLLERHGYMVVKIIPGLDTFLIHESFADEYRNNSFRFFQGVEICFELRDPSKAH